MDVETVLAEVTRAGSGGSRPGSTASDGPPPTHARIDNRDPMVRAEALSLGVLFQAADAVRNDAEALAITDELSAEAYVTPAYRTIFSSISAAGGVREAGPDWITRVLEQAPEELASTINGLAVTPLPHDKAETLGLYARSILAKVLDAHLTRRVGELRGSMQRAGEGTDEYWRIFGDITALETRRRSLRAE